MSDSGNDKYKIFAPINEPYTVKSWSDKVDETQALNRHLMEWFKESVLAQPLSDDILKDSATRPSATSAATGKHYKRPFAVIDGENVMVVRQDTAEAWADVISAMISDERVRLIISACLGETTLSVLSHMGLNLRNVKSNALGMEMDQLSRIDDKPLV